ncbi:HdeD family acid-resistance protein [uncultured Sphingomonas sp.]|uniref:HdeD family acid-resistance protein n=1 Tax=uncultured Sphingomonas sp. TaxID=158754 RepID=UPI0035CB9D4B
MIDTLRDPLQAAAPIGAGWGWIMAYGILSVLIGIAAFAWPFAATYAATLIVGGFLIAAGAVSIAAGVAAHDHHGRGYAIGFGVVSLVIGLVMAFDPPSGAISLTVLVAVWLGLRGAMELVVGSRIRRGRGLMIGLGIVNILLAIYIFATLPWSALTLLGFILGVSFLFGGVTATVAAARHRDGTEPFAIPT